MFKKSPLKSQKLIKKKRRILYLKIGGVLLGIIIFITLLSLLSHLSLFRINTVVVQGNSAVDAQKIKDIAQSELQGKYVYLFPRSNRFIYPHDTIEKKVYEHSLRIKNVELEVNNHDLIISLQERDPSYTWCTGLPTEKTSHTCYFLDENGYVFSEAPIFSGNAFFAFYGEVDNEAPLGKTYLNAQQFNDIDALIEFLQSHNLHPFAFHAYDNGIYDLYLERGGKIIFKVGQDMSVLISNIDLILKNTQLLSKQASILEYIDLRFGNKLFYKLKGDNEVPLAQ